MTALSILTKVLTALVFLGCATLTVWSLLVGFPLIMPFVCLLLTAVMGFFTYTDIKKLLTQ